jgi:hypothetical protein
VGPEGCCCFGWIAPNPVDVPKFIGPGVLSGGLRRHHDRAMMLASSLTRADGFGPARGRGAERQLQARRASSGSSPRRTMRAPHLHATQTIGPSTPASSSPQRRVLGVEGVESRSAGSRPGAYRKTPASCEVSAETRARRHSELSNWNAWRLRSSANLRAAPGRTTLSASHLGLLVDAHGVETPVVKLGGSPC